jgi:transcriptional regulator with XRE-family HTH domain
MGRKKSPFNRERLKMARIRMGLTQTELGARIGSCQSTIGQYERGTRTPDLATLKDLQKILQVHETYLMFESPEGVPDALPGDYGPADDPRLQILADYRSQHGLRELAAAHEVYTALKITPAEWEALHSFNPTGQLTLNGYLSILFSVRTAIEQL